MGKNLEKKKNNQKRRKINILIMMVASLGVMLSVYLWSVHLSGSDVLCATGGCDEVLKGEFSEIASVPVAALGVAFYAAVIALAVQRKMIQHIFLDKMLYLLLGSGVVFTLYLRYLEFAKIGDICSWCWGSVVIVTILGILLIVDAKLAKL